MPDKIAWEISQKFMEGLITEDEALSNCVVSISEVLLEIGKDNSFVIHPILVEQSVNLAVKRLQDVSVTLALITKQVGSDEFEKEWDC